MSKIDQITRDQGGHNSSFANSYGKFTAAETVLALIGNMTEVDAASAVAPPRDALEQSYRGVQSFKRVRFDIYCEDLAVLAKTGVSALLQMKSEGRTNLDTATKRLVSEIEGLRVKTVRALGH